MTPWPSASKPNRYSLLVSELRNSLVEEFRHCSDDEQRDRLKESLSQVNMALDLATRLASLVNLSVPETKPQTPAANRSAPVGKKKLSKFEISKPVLDSFRRMQKNGSVGPGGAGGPSGTNTSQQANMSTKATMSSTATFKAPAPVPRRSAGAEVLIEEDIYGQATVTA